jgi:hypothetical protein
MLRAIGSPGKREGEVREAVDRLWPDPKLGAVAGPLPAGGHEQRVLEERVEVADGEERRRQVVQLGIERGEVGVAQLLEVAVAGEGRRNQTLSGVESIGCRSRQLRRLGVPERS